MVGWHHWPNGPEFKQAPGDGEGQGSKSQTQLSNWTTSSLLRNDLGPYRWLCNVRYNKSKHMCRYDNVVYPFVTLLYMYKNLSGKIHNVTSR